MKIEIGCLEHTPSGRLHTIANLSMLIISLAKTANFHFFAVLAALLG